MIGCGDDSGGSGNDSNKNSACVASGGMDDGNRCKCDGVTCDEGILCNTLTNRCANLPSGEANSACEASGGMDEGVWSTEKGACTDGNSCTADGKCGECTDGDTKADCENGKVTKCLNGAWSTQKVKCNDDNDVSCTSDGKCGVCVNETITCEDDKYNNGVLGDESMGKCRAASCSL